MNPITILGLIGAIISFVIMIWKKSKRGIFALVFFLILLVYSFAGPDIINIKTNPVSSISSDSKTKTVKISETPIVAETPFVIQPDIILLTNTPVPMDSPTLINTLILTNMPTPMETRVPTEMPTSTEIPMQTESPASTETPVLTENSTLIDPPPTNTLIFEDEPEASEPLSVILSWENTGEYGKIVTLNESTNMSTTFIAFYLPAGIYTVKNNAEKGAAQVSVYSDIVKIDQVEELSDEDCAFPIVIMASKDPKEIEIKEGQFVKLSDNSYNIEFKRK